MTLNAYDTECIMTLNAQVIMTLNAKVIMTLNVIMTLIQFIKKRDYKLNVIMTLNAKLLS